MNPDFDYEADGTFPVLPFLLVVSLLVIIVLSISLYHYKRRLEGTQEYLVRYITYCLELKKQVPTSEQPYSFNPPEITCKEFTKIIENMLKRILFIPFFALFILPLAAQEQPDSTGVYIFRFVPEKDIFFIPYRQNESELQRLQDTLKVCMPPLNTGRMYVNVSSYAASVGKELSVRRMAYLRNSRVKSHLIICSGLKEEMFVTDRIIPHAYGPDSLRNVVVVTFPATVEKVAAIAGEEAAGRVATYNKEVYGDSKAECLAAEQVKQAEHERLTAERARQDEQERAAAQEAEKSAAARAEAEQCTARLAEEQRLALEATKHEDGYTLALRANLLRWATLTPDLGLEWRINRSWGIQVNGSWTSWSWDNKNRRYALWEVSPEVRYYIGKEKRGYLSAIYHIGEFNYKLGDTGRQGDLQGGGITGGYQLRLNRALSLDFSLGIGCTHADYDKYTVIDGVRVKQGKQDKNYWGVNHAGITLIWKFVK